MSSRRHDLALNDYFERLLSAPAAAGEDTPAYAPAPVAVPLAAPVTAPAAKPVATPVATQVIAGQLERLLAEVAVLTEADTVTASELQSPVAIEAAKIKSATLLAELIALAPVQTVSAADTVTITSVGVSALSSAITSFRAQLPARFQTLIFQVGELKLALPLHLLGGILRRDKVITPLFGKAPWFMGLLAHQPDHIQVVDTARFLLAERWQGDTAQDYCYIVVLGDSTWGLASQGLCHTVLVERDDVRWFAGAERRPWLAGMLKDEKCALLNSAALKLMLAQA